MVEIKKYNLQWFKLTYNVLYCGILTFIGYRLFVLCITFFHVAQTEEQKLLWIILIGMLGFAIRFRFPRFDKFYTIHRY